MDHATANATGAVTWWQLNQLAVWEVVLVGAATGLIGALALMHRRIFFAEAVSHAAFPGAVLGVVAGAALAPGRITELIFAGALIGCLVLAGVMAVLVRLPGISSQAAAGIVLSSGFGLGYFAATWFAPLPVRVESFLTGSVLTANAVDVAAAGVVLALAVVAWWGVGPRLVSLGFSEALFRASIGTHRLYDALVLVLVCLGIVVAIPAVGTIVSIALIAAPPAILRPWVRTPGALLAGSPLVGIAIGLVGLASAQWWGLSAGGMIALWSGVIYAASVGGRQLT
ncbi:metal ABC transporter permease [Corynebacterium timonense]|uniref:ABC-type Mn2+/Zn2+ transport system, permease component n=1 Tax=Corynebacterium timonense TaxID=441500 RepID=A0A1H1LJ09_9CORY|nr:metal ABC transporter permease [Corynebacterium timonense]SDR74533.1 ABC-type Mn2+/Zn2+ transport system, permease component [Corynebacterium timonense]